MIRGMPSSSTMPPFVDSVAAACRGVFAGSRVFLAYAYGSLLLGHGGQPAAITAFEMDWLHLGDSMVALAQWMLSLGPRLGVGLVALALTLAGIGYFTVQVAWRVQVTLAWRARARRRATKVPE